MADKVLENNQVSIVGEIVSEFTFSHEVYGEGFYTVDVAVSRLSNYADYIPLMVSERLIDTSQSYVGEKVYVTGQFRSYNRHEETRNRLILSVFVREIQFVDDMWEEDVADLPSKSDYPGRLCVQAAGLSQDGRWAERSADLLVAVNRAYGKSDYIPCICWEETPDLPRPLRSAPMYW